MSNNPSNPIAKPNLVTLIITVVVCIGLNMYLISSATNAFTETLFQRKNMVMIGLMSMSILVTFMIYANYIKNKYSK